MKRDTVTTPASGYLVIRFKADNPGVWMFHCHMEFHGTNGYRAFSAAKADRTIVEAGMMVTMIESPDILQKTVPVARIQLDICLKQGIPTQGNCAGDTQHVLNDSGCRNTLPDENWG
jgi:iron transport multicopper oxidase